LKGPFSWIIAMAGYAPTPAEEMTGRERTVETPKADAPIAQQPREREEPPSDAPSPSAQNGNEKRTITGKQASRIWALGFSQGVDKKITGQILNGFGFQRAEDVTVEKYEELCAAVENAGAGTAH
jgi:hypothetical protein